MKIKVGLIASEKSATLIKIGGFSPEQHYLKTFEKDTDVSEVKIAFEELLKKEDIGILFISDNFYQILNAEINSHCKTVPTILKIPSFE